MKKVRSLFRRTQKNQNEPSVALPGDSKTEIASSSDEDQGAAAQLEASAYDPTKRKVKITHHEAHIQSDREYTKSEASMDQGNHIMISYSWAQQETALQVKNGLEKFGYKMWIDVENMSGSLLDSMAEAVENSGIVLMLMSMAYKQSMNTKREAQYILKKRIPFIPLLVESGYQADGWLGLILGAKLCFDFSQPENFEAKLAALAREIERNWRPSSTSHKNFVQLSRRISVYREPLRTGTRIYKGIYKPLDRFEQSQLVATKLVAYNVVALGELETLPQLRPHPNVVQIIECGECQIGVRQIYIAMELCSLQNLQDYFDTNRRKYRPLDKDKTMRFSKQLIDGMQHIHHNGIIHGHLQPSSVLLSKDSTTLKIANFGMNSDSSHERSAVYIRDHGQRAIGFNAPEIHNSGVISKQADIYPLGIIMHGLWSNGKHPFGDEPLLRDYNIKKNEGRDISGILIFRTERDQLLNLIDQTLQPDPSKRPTIDEVAQHPFMTIALTPTKSEALDRENAAVLQLQESYHKPAREIGAKESAQSTQNRHLLDDVKGSKGHPEMMEDPGCSICMDRIPDEMLQCGQAICSVCLEKMLRSRICCRCPYCRGEHNLEHSFVEKLLKKIAAESSSKDSRTPSTQLPAHSLSNCPFYKYLPALDMDLALMDPNKQGTSTTQQTKECSSNAEESETVNDSPEEPKDDQQNLELHPSSELPANPDVQGASTTEQTAECSSSAEGPSAVDSAAETEEFEYGFTPVETKNIIAVSGGELSIEDYKIEFPENSVSENKEMAMSLKMDFRKVQIPQHVVPVSAMLGVDYQGHLNKLASFSIPIWFVPEDPSDKIMIFKSKPQKNASDPITFEHKFDAEWHDGKVVFSSDHFSDWFAGLFEKKLKNGSLSLAHALLHNSCTFKVIVCYLKPASLLKKKIKHLRKDGYKKIHAGYFKLAEEECDVKLESYEVPPYNFHPEIRKVERTEVLRCKKAKNNPLKIAIDKTFLLMPPPEQSATICLKYTMDGTETEQFGVAVHPARPPGPQPGIQFTIQQHGGTQTVDQSTAKKGVLTAGLMIAGGGQDNSTQYNTKNTAVVGDKVASETMKSQNT